MLRLLSRFIFWLQGWKIDDALIRQKKYSKFILAGAPHTSNWDALMFIAAIYHMKLDVKFLIKESWLKFPFGYLFEPLGAIGIDRSKSSSMVDQMTQLFNASENLIITISPEGTRSKNTKWKTGFYHTAVSANVSILLGYLDYENKIAGIGKEVVPSGNLESDLKLISDYYLQFKGKVPENYGEYLP